VDQQPLRDAGYSPATILEMQRWASSVSGATAHEARGAHVRAAIMALEFVMEHEQDPGEVAFLKANLLRCLHH
jgi:hypothetical protein